MCTDMISYHSSTKNSIPSGSPIKNCRILSLFQKVFIDKTLRICYYHQAGENAGVAQSVEQLICNQQVGGSSPSTSSTMSEIEYGGIPEWPKGTDCKSAGNAFGGSNPPSPTRKRVILSDGSLFFDWVIVKVDSKGGSWRQSGGLSQPPWLFRRKANPPSPDHEKTSARTSFCLVVP